MSIMNECIKPAENSCIDHIFLKKANLENNLGSIKGYILQYLITDHFPIILNLELANKVSNHNNKGLNMKNYINYIKLREDLENKPWSEM